MDEGIVAVAGIVGTLLGTIVGVVSSAWIQRRQLEHEDRTRFHEQRLAVYAEFNDACNRMMSSLVRAHPVSLEDSARYLRSFETLRLISSKAVCGAAGDVHTIVGTAWAAGITPAAEALFEFNKKVADLCAAIRAETGTDKY